jgi:hypothetical protein
MSTSFNLLYLMPSLQRMAGQGISPYYGHEILYFPLLQGPMAACQPFHGFFTPVYPSPQTVVSEFDIKPLTKELYTQ